MTSYTIDTLLLAPEIDRKSINCGETNELMPNCSEFSLNVTKLT